MREHCKIIQKCTGAFAWITMLKALIGKLTKFRKRRIENVMSVDVSDSQTIEESLAWDWSIPYQLNLETLVCFPHQSSVTTG